MVIELAAAWPRSLKYSGFINRRNEKGHRWWFSVWSFTVV